MNYEIIDNVLPQNDHKRIENLLTGGTKFPWYHVPKVNLLDKENNYFVHNFYLAPLHDYITEQSEFFDVIKPLLYVLKPKSILRIKANFYPSNKNLIRHAMHYDYGFPHLGALYYVNDNDGFTILEDGTKIESKANRLLKFEPHLLHCSTNCTDTYGRININFNYF